MNTVFHLIRHAAHDDLGMRLTGRMGGAGLSERGREQANALARYFVSHPLDAIGVSPRERARETAEAIAAACGIAPETADELDEIDFGDWAGRSFEALRAEPAWTRWNEDRGNARTPAGESMDDVAGRLVALVERLRGEFPGGSVALVSHCDVIKAGVCRYLGLVFDRMHRFEVDPASVTTIVVGEWGAKVLAVNRAFAGGDAP